MHHHVPRPVFHTGLGRGRLAPGQDGRLGPRLGPGGVEAAVGLRELRGVLPLHGAVRRQLLQEPAGPVGGGVAIEHTLAGVTYGEGLPGPGEGHVAKPPLLLDLLAVADGPHPGEQSLLHAHQEHVGELHTLGGVHGHHHRRVGGGVVLLNIGVQGDFLQEARQARLRGAVAVADDGGAQLLDVLQPHPVVGAVLGRQHGGVAGLDDELVVEIRQGHLADQGHAQLDEVGEGLQLHRRALQGRIVPGVAQNLKQREIGRVAEALCLLQGLGADAPGRDVDDAPQAQVVGGVLDDPEVGQHVLDLCPVEEPGAADDAVGHPLALEGLLQGVGLGVVAVEHCTVAEPPGLPDLPGHKGSLVVLVRRLVDRDGAAGVVVGPELLALAAPVVGDDAVGRLQNGLGGAVVLLQPDDLCALEPLLEAQNVLDGGAPEAVDALVVVAHHADVLIPARQQGGQQVLQVVGVLVLVDEHVAELALVEAAGLLVVLQKQHRLQDQVVEVHGVGGLEAALVVRIGPGNALQTVVPGVLGHFRVAFGQQELVLCLGYLVQNDLGREGLLVQAHVVEHVLHHPLGVGGIVDGKAAGVAQLLPVAAQDTAAGGVEGHGPHVQGLGPQHGLQAAFQLSGGLVGEGDGDDVPGRGGVHPAEVQRPGRQLAGFGALLQIGHVLLAHPVGDLLALGGGPEPQQVGDPVDKYRGLAAAGPRQQQQRPLGGEDGLALPVVEPGKASGDQFVSGGQIPRSQFLCHSGLLGLFSSFYLKPGHLSKELPQLTQGLFLDPRDLHLGHADDARDALLGQAVEVAQLDDQTVAFP